jgi:hypothetical protein
MAFHLTAYINLFLDKSFLAMPQPCWQGPISTFPRLCRKFASDPLPLTFFWSNLMADHDKTTQATEENTKEYGHGHVAKINFSITT